METIARWSAAADDNNFDDQGQRRDRLARGAGVGDDRVTVDMARRIEQLEAALQHHRGEVENIRERSSATGRAGTPRGADMADPSGRQAPSGGRFAGQDRHPSVFAAAETPRPQSTYHAAGSSQQPWTGGTSPDVSKEQSRRRRTVVCCSCGQPGASAESVRHRDVDQKGSRRRLEASESYVDAVVLLFITHKMQHKKTYIIQIQHTRQTK